MGSLNGHNYPDLTLNEAIDLIRKVGDLGGRVSPSGLAKMIGIDPRGAGLHSRVSDLKEYGLLEESKEGLKLTSLGERIVRGDTAKAWDAFMNIPLYSEMHERLKGKEPDKIILHRILFEITKAEDDAISRRLARLKNNYMEALPYQSGERQLGEDEMEKNSQVSSHPRLEGPWAMGHTFSVTDYSFYLVDKRETPFFIGLDSPSKIDLAIRYLKGAKASLGENKPRTERKPSAKKTEAIEQPIDQ